MLISTTYTSVIVIGNRTPKGNHLERRVVPSGIVGFKVSITKHFTIIDIDIRKRYHQL